MMSKQGVIRTYDLHPDGVRLIVDWESMGIGASVFVPCVNTEAASAQAKKIFDSKGWQLQTEIRIEGNTHLNVMRLGLRIWRIL
jgi:hypothetical protein|tara:strand:- start:32 stop:283 length:252 start_codon:yes stop_codon:yes gene_type:complete